MAAPLKRCSLMAAVNWCIAHAHVVIAVTAPTYGKRRSTSIIYWQELTMQCPECNSTNHRVIESRLCTNGTRRRRLICIDCSHRMTVWDGERAPTTSRSNDSSRKRSRARGLLTVDHVLFALQHTELSNREVADQLECSTETVRQIRCGLLYRHVAPDVRRPKGAPGQPSCSVCTHWNGEACDFRFPDPLEEGLSFAAECSMYQKRSTIKS
jgi:hypothetical protein